MGNATFCAAQGRYSYVGAQPALEVVAKEGHVTVLDHHKGTRVVQARCEPRNGRMRRCADALRRRRRRLQTPCRSAST
jgi:hypothetical protein